MTEMRSKFVTASERPSEYLEASLNFMVADTRRGLSSEAALQLAVVKEHVKKFPDAIVAAGYVERMETALGRSPGRVSAPPAPRH